MESILVTGVCGFIAGNVIEYLVDKYPERQFVGVDKMSYCSNIKNIEGLEKKNNFIFIKADITNLEFMTFIFEKYNIRTILHFAAYTHVDNSFGNSIIFTQNNIVGTHILLEVSKNRGISRFIHVSTDEVYGSVVGDEATENSILDPTNPYSATKAGAEHLVKSYFNSFKLPIIITRGNNVYGPKQYPEKVIPKFILRLLSNHKCIIQGSGNQLRSFLHVNDVCRAFDLIMNKGVVGEIYNIGTDDEYTINTLAVKIVQLVKPEEEDPNLWICRGKDRAFNDQRYRISTNKLGQLGWKQEIDLTTGLNLTYDWYKNNRDYWDNISLKTCLEI